MYYNLIHRKFIRFLTKVQRPGLKEAATIQTQDFDFPYPFIGRKQAGTAPDLETLDISYGKGRGSQGRTEGLRAGGP